MRKINVAKIGTLLVLCAVLLFMLMSCSDIIGGNPYEESEFPQKNNTVYLSTLPELLSYNEKDGQRVEINMTAMPTNIGKTVTIGGDVNEVVFRGIAGQTYSALNLIVAPHDTLDLKLVFENMSIVGDSPNGTIFCDNGRSITICSEGMENTVTGAVEASAINAPGSALTLDGTASLTLSGGDGMDGVHGMYASADGGHGAIGAIAVIVRSLHKCGNSQAVLMGGNGGMGGNGADGAAGTVGASGNGNSFFTFNNRSSC